MPFFKKKYHQYSDEQLIPLIAKGNEHAFNEIYKRYGNRLHNYFFKMLARDKERANDFTQDLFMKLVQKAETFDVSRKFSTWLYTIASNQCKNEYRRIKRSPFTKLEPELEPNGIIPLFPEHIDQAYFKEQLQKAVNQLAPNHKQCFLLRYQEELSIKEISDIMNCPEGTIKSRIHYCLKKLADQLKFFNPKKDEENPKKKGFL